jgi:hypothetical protein
MAKWPPVPCFNLARTPEELKPWILREDMFNPYTPTKITLCQRTVYLTILTLRALLQATPYTVRWEISDYNGIGTYVYLVNTQEKWEVELAEIVCTNNRWVVRGVRMAHSPLTATTRDCDGLEGLQSLLMNAALFAEKLRPNTFALPIVGGTDNDQLLRLIKRSADKDGQRGASFIHILSLPLKS